MSVPASPSPFSPPRKRDKIPQGGKAPLSTPSLPAAYLHSFSSTLTVVPLPPP